eukprot:TRINITY_DN36275_c0_g1_i2.p1 TRINITY_DN36275_c0_g1~~TRINITY_DN36275_c0_g1_i2.p1  ORF type:complete len:1253 (+),score=254.54 TRINITY_DN36275_c0_g1_i2:148-3906(+)
MESKDLEDLCNTTGPEDETVANLKKRSRRVSFADNITTFHVFDRDDEFETPPDGKPSSENENGESAVGSETPGLRGDSAESDDSKELMQNENDEEEDDDEEGRELFVRNMDFSSSPGSVAGSVTSNEEDNFFGPVSTSFIRSGRLSTESATSDNDHDITMDSTAFSLHFRNLMQSDEQRSNSEGNFKTPTGVHLTFGEETCGDSMQTNGENFMVLTGVKKMIPHYTSGGRSNGGGDSNDMSLIVENPNKYDYGKLSPGLDALLAEVQHVSVSNQINISKSPKSPSSSNRLSGFYERTSEPMDLKCSGGVKVRTTKVEVVSDAISKAPDADRKASDADNGNCIFTSGHKTSYSSSGINETLPADTAFGLWNGAQNEPIQGMFSGMDKESGKDSLGVSQQPQREIGCPNNGHTSSPLNKATPKNLIAQHDCGPTGHITDRIEENSHFSYSSPVPVAASPMFAVLGHRQRLAESPNSGKYVPNDVQNAEKDSEQPSSPGSISSLRAKRQRLSLGTSVLASTGHISTPFSAYESCSLLEKEGLEHGVRLSSMKNKISKLSLFETREVGANPMSSLSHLANKPSLFEDILIRNNSDPKLMPVGHSDGGGHLLANAEENTTQEIEVEMHGYRVEAPKNFNTSRLSGKSPAIFHGGGHGSGKHVDVNALRLDNPIEAAVSTSQMHKTAEIKNMKKVTVASTMFMSSPMKRLEQKISPSGPVSPPLRILNQQNQCGNPFGSSSSQQIEDTSRTTPNVSQLLTPGAEGTIGSSSLPKSNTGRSTLPLATINPDVFRSHAKREETASQESFLQDLRKELNSTISYQTPMSNRVNLNFFSSSHEKNAQKMECTKSGEKFSIDREFRASSHESASPNIAKRTGPRTLPEKVVQSAEAYNLTENNSLILPSWEFPVSSTLRQGLRGLDHNESQLSPSVQRSLLIPDADTFGRKTINKSVFMEKNEMNDSNTSKRSRKVLLENEGALGFCLENHVAGITEADMIRGEPPEKHWRDVFSKFSAASEQLLPTYTDKLNTRQLGIVEDILGQLQRLKKYEKICTEIQSQKMPPHLGNILQPRVVEARWLQHALMFERLKLQLVHLKRDRLLRKVQQLQSGILDCHSLKSNILQHHLGKRDYQNEGGCVQSDSVECSTENQDSHHTVIRMRKELGVLDHKVKKIIKFFQASCKIKGDRNSDEIVELINDHLQRQERCRIIRQYLLLWEIDDIERKDDSHNIILNYHGLLSQRLTKKQQSSFKYWLFQAVE